MQTKNYDVSRLRNRIIKRFIVAHSKAVIHSSCPEVNGRTLLHTHLNRYKCTGMGPSEEFRLLIV